MKYIRTPTLPLKRSICGEKNLRCQAACYKKLQREQKKETMTQCNELLLSVTRE